MTAAVLDHSGQDPSKVNDKEITDSEFVIS